MNDGKKPRRFDRNLVVIGAGAGGLVAAYIAAAVRAKVTLVEAHRMGGDCLNTGCVPSKALIRVARLLRDLRRAGEMGVELGAPRVDFAAVMARVRAVIAEVEPHDSVERYTALGVEVIEGRAHIDSPWSVRITGADGERILTTRAIVVATGAVPVVPRITGIERVRHVTSDTVWSLTERPERLVVLGGGPIGCELAQAFASLGCTVTLVSRSGLLPREDADVAALVEAGLAADGVRRLTGAEPLRCEVEAGEQRLVVRAVGAEEALPFDVLLCATGRRARVRGFGLEELGVALTPAGTLAVNEYLQTSVPGIYACGDVAGPWQFTHAAAHQAWHAAVNPLFAGIRRFKVDDRVMPRVTFTDPEIASVGLTEADARAQGVACEVSRFDLAELDRAIADGAAQGFVKVLTLPGRDRILGATVVGAHAGEMLAEFTLAMQHGLGLNRLLATIHPYPTWSEAAKYTAGAWKRAHAPQRLLGWLERFHAWRRG